MYKPTYTYSWIKSVKTHAHIQSRRISYFHKDFEGGGGTIRYIAELLAPHRCSFIVESVAKFGYQSAATLVAAATIAIINIQYSILPTIDFLFMATLRERCSSPRSSPSSPPSSSSSSSLSLPLRPSRSCSR